MCDDETINCMAVCLCGITKAVAVVGKVSIRQEEGNVTEWKGWNCFFLFSGSATASLVCESDFAWRGSSWLFSQTDIESPLSFLDPALNVVVISTRFRVRQMSIPPVQQCKIVHHLRVVLHTPCSVDCLSTNKVSGKSITYVIFDLLKVSLMTTEGNTSSACDITQGKGKSHLPCRKGKTHPLYSSQ